MLYSEEILGAFASWTEESKYSFFWGPPWALLDMSLPAQNGKEARGQGEWVEWGCLRPCRIPEPILRALVTMVATGWKILGIWICQCTHLLILHPGATPTHCLYPPLQSAWLSGLIYSCGFLLLIDSSFPEAHFQFLDLQLVYYDPDWATCISVPQCSHFYSEKLVTNQVVHPLWI